MTDPAFTQGDWFASATFRSAGTAPGIDIGSSNGANIAIAHHDTFDRDGRETRANAHLIAAAPDLYEALNGLIENPERLSAHKRARAALAKARGEQS